MKGRLYCAPLCVIVFAVIGAGSKVFGADQAPAESAENSKTRALEERVKQLEQHILNLEAKNREVPAQPQSFGMQQGDFNRMFEEMRREMLDMNGFFGNGLPQMQGLPLRRNLEKLRAPNPGRLGIAVGEVNDETKSRFKNDVKEGAFVLSVAPNSPAQKAGVVPGDAILAFDGTKIDRAQTLIDAVRNASKAQHEMTVSRRGEPLVLKVDLKESTANNNDPFNSNESNLDQKTHMELKVSALQLDDNLAQELGLNGDQKKKMTDVLAAHSKALSAEFSKSFSGERDDGAFGFTITGNLNGLATKHADNAAKELATVLTPEQLKKWNDYRTSHLAISFSQTTQRGGLESPAVPEEDDGSRIKF